MRSNDRVCSAEVQVRFLGRIRRPLDSARRRVPHRSAVGIRTVFPDNPIVHHYRVDRFPLSQFRHVHYRWVYILYVLLRLAGNGLFCVARKHVIILEWGL